MERSLTPVEIGVSRPDEKDFLGIWLLSVHEAGSGEVFSFPVVHYRDWIISTAGLNEKYPTQDSGPSDDRFIDFSGEVARVGSSITPAGLGAEDMTSSSNVPIGPAALISLILGIITAVRAF